MAKPHLRVDVFSFEDFAYYAVTALQPSFSQLSLHRGHFLIKRRTADVLLDSIFISTIRRYSQIESQSISDCG